MDAAKCKGSGRSFVYGLLLPAMITLLVPVTAHAASLEPITLKAWEEYVQSANVRMEQRLGQDQIFLWVDEATDRLARVRAGEVVVSPVGTQNPKRLPSGLIHDWIGAAFIADATLMMYYRSCGITRDTKSCTSQPWPTSRW